MAPDFALFLSPEGIALAQRQPGGHWAVLGDTPLDVPDLGAALIVLRKLAEARVGKGFPTLILLPDDQVLYTSLTAPGPDEADRMEQIRAGLDGLTPYPVEDLVFDWFPLEDGRVKLAVVARETLDEARSFAEANGFAPAGFGARPLDNRYRGVAHFDRSLDWTAEIPDIEFGHDTWHKARAEAARAAEEAEDDSVTDETPDTPETGDEATPDTDQGEPVQDAAPPAPEPEATPDAPENPNAAPPAQETAPPLDEPATARPRLSLGLPQDDAAPDAPAPAQEPATEPEPDKDTPLQVPAGFGAHRRNPPAETAATGLKDRKPRFGPGAEPGDAAAADSVETAAPAPKTDAPEGEAPAKPAAENRAEPVFGRSARGLPPEPAVAAKDPAKPGKTKPAKPAKPGSPARPSAAGPEPQLPPLARVKSRIKDHRDSGAEPRPASFGPNPFAGPPPSLAGDKPSLRDRMAGIGRQLTDSTGKARDAASDLSSRIGRRGSGLGDKLRGLGRKPDEEAPAPAPEAADSATATPDAEAKPKAATADTGDAKATRRFGLGRKGATAPKDAPAQAPARGTPGRTRRFGWGRKDAEPRPDETPADEPAAPAAAAPLSPPPQAAGARRFGWGRKAQAPASKTSPKAAARIAPPPAKADRRPGAAAGAIPDADATLMGGLLARGDIARGSGPSLRTGLILTMILLAVLALIGIWAAVYLPETALGRWMGLGTESEDIIVVETAPEVLETPLPGGTTLSAQDAPEVMALLTPEAGPPSPVMTAPAAPELLPDIDAEVLDLGPAPVTSPVIDPETVLPSEEENANFYVRTGVWQRPPVITLPQPEARMEEVVFVGLDPELTLHDAIALPVPTFSPRADLPTGQTSSEPLFALDPADMVAPTPEGAMTPYGVLIYAGPPPLMPERRPGPPPEPPEPAAEAETPPEPEALAEDADPALPPGAVETALLQAVRPEPRPEDLSEQRERAALGGVTIAELAAFRPLSRPLSFQEQAAAAAAAAGATDPDAEPGDFTGATELAVAVSFLPAPRPANIDEMVEQARAAGNAEPAPSAGGGGGGGGSETFDLEIPSSASVARAATEEGGINLRRVNLIGVSGTASERRALVRLPSGRFVTVEVGDRLDGGQVAAIGESSLQYVKQGRTITLEVPAG